MYQGIEFWSIPATQTNQAFWAKIKHCKNMASGPMETKRNYEWYY